MCLNYVNIYKQLGFNVLLIDLRGHGESDGIITWGQTEIRDMICGAIIFAIQNNKN